MRYSPAISFLVCTAGLLALVSSSAQAKTAVCVNKTELQVPIRMTFTNAGANLSANLTQCQVHWVPFRPTPSEPSGWVKLAANPGACLELGTFLTNADLTAISLSPEVPTGQQGFAQVSVGVSRNGTPAHVIQAQCFPTPD